MQINITMRHGHLSESSQERVVTKVEKLNRIFDRLTSIEVVVDLKEPSKPRVDINVSAEHKHDFIAHDQADSLLTAVESAVHKMEQQLRRYKEKVQTRGRDPGPKRQEPIVDTVESGEDAEE